MGVQRGQVKRLAAVIAAAGLLGAALAPHAPAAPLDEQTCAQLKREVADLEGLGVRESLTKGAAWGKANLNARQLEQVKKLIEIDETIAFRCPRPRPVPEVAAAAVPAKGKRPPKGAPKVKPEAPKVKPGEVAKAAAATKSQPRPAPATSDATAAAAPAPAKPRAKQPAPKPQDAYVPPAKANP